MKHILIGILFLWNIATAQDFRDFYWGASQQDIRQAEPWEFSVESEFNGNTLLVFKGVVANLDAEAYYEIDSESGLSRAGYIFTEPHINDNIYIDDFEKVKGILNRVYGPPTNTTQDWSNDLYKDDPSDYGIAIAAGHVEFNSLWETENTTISQRLSGDNFDISHVVLYTDVKQQRSLDQQQQETEDDAF